MHTHTRAHMCTHTVPYLPSSPFSMHSLLCHWLSPLWPVTFTASQAPGKHTLSLIFFWDEQPPGLQMRPFSTVLVTRARMASLAKTGTMHFHTFALFSSDSAVDANASFHVLLKCRFSEPPLWHFIPTPYINTAAGLSVFLCGPDIILLSYSVQVW